jgi:integrase
LAAFDPSIGGTRWRSLGFKVRDANGHLISEAVEESKRQASELSSALIRGESPGRDVTAGELLRLFRREELASLQGKHWQEMERELELWEAYLGSGFRMPSFGIREWNGMKRDRASGAVDQRGKRVNGERRPVGARTVEKSLKAFRQVCRFGEKYRTSTGRPLLPYDPTRGLALPSEPNPKRPICDDETYAKLLEASHQVTMRVGGKLAPSYLPELLVLAAHTGRRIGAIVALRYSDWVPGEATFGVLRWRADSDKLRRESRTPVTPEVRDVLEKILQQRSGDGEAYLFPAPDSDGHVAVTLASRWFRKAEAAAKLTRRENFGFHSLRRMFATKLKGESIKDVAELGGWKSTQVLQSLYQRADQESMERVLMAGRDVRLKGTA